MALIALRKNKMAIGNAANYTPINGDYIPIQYAPKLLTKWYKGTIYEQVMDTEYEGMIKKYGDTVKIRQRPTITGGAYKRGEIFSYTYVGTTSIELKIDQSYYWEFAVDDIDEAQVDLKFINDWIDEAVNQQRIYTETLIFNAAPALVVAANKGKTAGAESASYDLGTTAEPVHIASKEDYTDPDTGVFWKNASDLCVDMCSVLDENNTPEESMKFIIGPSIFRNRVAKSAIKSADVTGDAKGVIRGGPRYVGEVGGMYVYSANTLTKILGGTNGNTSVFPVLFGVNEGWTFAGQIDSIKAFDLQNTFGMGHQGLWVFGWAIKIEEGLGVAYVTTDATDD